MLHTCIAEEIEESYKPVYLFEALLKSKQEKKKLLALETLKTKQIPFVQFALTKNHTAIKQNKLSFKDLKGYVQSNIKKNIKENILFTENSLSQTCCSILDLNFACNILRHPEKKNIVVCAGYNHTSQLQKFLNKLGYIKTSSTGADIDQELRGFLEIIDGTSYKFSSNPEKTYSINLEQIVTIPFAHTTV